MHVSVHTLVDYVLRPPAHPNPPQALSGLPAVTSEIRKLLRKQILDLDKCLSSVLRGAKQGSGAANGEPHECSRNIVAIYLPGSSIPIRSLAHSWGSMFGMGCATSLKGTETSS